MIKIPSLPAWFNSLATKHNDEEKAALTVWHNAIRAKNKVDQQQLRAAMAILRKTFPDLKVALADHQERAAWREQADRIPDLEKQSAEITAKQIAAREAYKEAGKQLERDLAELGRTLAPVENDLRACRAAERKLREGRPEQSSRLLDLRARLDTLQEQASFIKAAISQTEQNHKLLTEELGKRRTQAPDDLRLAEMVASAHDQKNEMVARKTKLQRDLEKLENEMAMIAAEVEQLNLECLEV